MTEREKAMLEYIRYYGGDYSTVSVGREHRDVLDKLVEQGLVRIVAFEPFNLIVEAVKK